MLYQRAQYQSNYVIYPCLTIPMLYQRAQYQSTYLHLYENTNILYSKGGLYWGDIPEYLHALLLEHYTNTIHKPSDQTSDGNMTSSCRNIFG